MPGAGADAAELDEWGYAVVVGDVTDERAALAAVEACPVQALRLLPLTRPDRAVRPGIGRRGRGQRRPEQVGSRGGPAGPALGRRPVHLVNHRGGTILGRPVARRVAELDAPVDLVVIAVPAAAFAAAVDDALAAGARAIVGITAGLRRAGRAGRAVQARSRRRSRAHGAVLVGPNCLGVVDNTTELYLASDPFRSGTVALLSQSGNLALELDQRLAGHGLGFSRFVSLGNQADVTLVDLLASCAEHEPTRAIAVYAEDFGDGRAFAPPRPRPASRWSCCPPAAARPPRAAPPPTPAR